MRRIQIGIDNSDATSYNELLLEKILEGKAKAGRELRGPVVLVGIQCDRDKIYLQFAGEADARGYRVPRISTPIHDILFSL